MKEAVLNADERDAVTREDRLLYEIREQPHVLRGLLDSARLPLESLAEEMRRRQIVHVWHAAWIPSVRAACSRSLRHASGTASA